MFPARASEGISTGSVGERSPSLRRSHLRIGWSLALLSALLLSSPQRRVLGSIYTYPVWMGRLIRRAALLPFSGLSTTFARSVLGSNCPVAGP